MTITDKTTYMREYMRKYRAAESPYQRMKRLKTQKEYNTLRRKKVTNND